MHGILTKLLERAGVKDPAELDNNPMPDGTPSERQTFEQYKEILEKEKIEGPDLRNFCMAQMGVIQAQWADLTIPQSKKAELIPFHVVYSSLIQLIDSPKTNREQLIRQLEQMIK